MQRFAHQLSHGNVRCTQVQHLLCVVLHEQLLAHQVSSSSGRHPFDPGTFVPIAHKYLNAVIAGMDRYRHQPLDPHPNQVPATSKCRLQR